MSRLSQKINSAVARARRVRATVSGTSDRPRLAITVSNRHITAQVIDDTTHKTLVSATTVGKKISSNMTERAVFIGEEIAKVAKTKKITKVVFDRRSKLFHGRVKALADTARKNGLEF